MKKTMQQTIPMLLAMSSLACPLWAQTMPTDSLTQTSIFFESGKAVLNEAAQMALSQLVHRTKGIQDYELEIRAFTDDIGTESYNKNLAAQRAEAVRAYLKAQQIEALDARIESIGELALGDAKDLDATRRQHRRVDVTIQPFAPEKLSDVYGFFHRRHCQHFSVRPQSDTTLVGMKGTVLFIPAGSFVRMDGSAVTEPVKIELNEAYSYQDMLMHNLSTSSDGKILETGGMVHIAAHLPNGESVAIKKGEQILLSMPTTTADDDGMKLFVADRAFDNSAAPINWTTNNNAFIANSLQTQKPSFTFMQVRLHEADPILPLDMPPFPAKIPAAPAAPRKPYLSPDQQPDKTALQTTYPRQKGESDNEYNQRIDDRYASALRMYTQKMENNTKALARYEREKADYEAKMVVYKQQLAVQQQQTDLYISRLQHADALMDWARNFNMADGGLINAAIRLARETTNLKAYRDFLVQECQRYGLKQAAAEIKAIPLVESSTLMQDLAKKLISCSQNNQQLFDKRLKGYDDQLDKQMRFFRHHYNTMPVFNHEEGEMMASEDISLEDIYNTIQNFQSQISFFNDITENYNQVLRNSGFFALASKLDTICQQLAPHYDTVKERQWASKADRKAIQQDLMRTVGISQLGWINCDRFMNVPQEELMVVNVPVAHDEQTTFYAVFKNSRSVMSLDKATNHNGYARAGIPQYEVLTVIGIRVTDKKVEVCVEEAPAADIANRRFEFKPVKIAALRELLHV